MSHPANDSFTDNLSELNYWDLYKVYVNGEIDLATYDSLLDSMRSSCCHKYNIVEEGKGATHIKVCQKCFNRKSITL